MTGVFDITEYLPSNEGSFIFNPSIAHWRKNLYLCVYREFTRNRKPSGKPIERNRNHPWYKGTEGGCWWDCGDGHDYTRMCLLKIKGKNIRCVMKYDGIEGVDCRAFYMGDDHFLLSYNSYNARNDRFEIHVRNFYISPENYQGYIEEFGLNFGKDISAKTEKNWSFWKHNDELYFTYGLKKDWAKHYRVLAKGDHYKGVDMKMRILNPYLNNFPGCISTSTPAIDYGNGLKLAVGHLKYEYDKELTENTRKFHNFITQDWGMKTHPIYVYCMFFYTFEANTGCLDRVSPFFMLRDREEYALQFPSGLTKCGEGGENFLVSYGGGGDANCKTACFSRDQVEGLLRIKNEETFLVIDPGDERFIHYRVENEERVGEKRVEEEQDEEQEIDNIILRDCRYEANDEEYVWIRVPRRVEEIFV